MSPRPLITHVYTADPSAHVFEDKLYLYPSHDRETDIPDNDNGDQYDMVDYHVFSMDSIDGPVKDHGIALSLSGVPWASKQLWAPDVAKKNGEYYFFFPARDKAGIFRIGVAHSKRPEGPFRPEPEPIKGSYSIDPCSFVDDDGQAYLYFGGIWGGQLQCWRNSHFDPKGKEPADHEPALGARVGVLSDDMKSFKEPVKEIQILDENGKPLLASDHERRFFESPWMYKRNGVYYFTYSTGNTHFLVYATSKSPLGPFTYQGRILEPVVGWTTHQSIVDFKGKSYLFYHDSSLSGGKNHLRCVKVREITFDANGKIKPMNGTA
ncbi:MAG: glycoside hydrolase family 43 protein [Nibricoccus sp.]